MGTPLTPDLTREGIEKELHEYFDTRMTEDFGYRDSDVVDFAEYIKNKAVDLGEYEKIELTLKELPQTWCPALVITIIERALRLGNVFKDNNPIPFVEKIHQKILKENRDGE